MIQIPENKNIDILAGARNIEPLRDNIFEDKVCSFLNDLSKELIRNKFELDSDIIAFSYWCRQSNINKFKRQFADNFKRVGIGMVFHIPPSNVPTNFAYSFVYGLISGNANIVKMSNSESKQGQLIIKKINDLFSMKKYKSLRASNTFLRYPNDDSITKYFSKLCDGRILWGGDITINYLRKFLIKENGREIIFPDKYSFCIINGKNIADLNPIDLRKVANKFYNDTYFIDQNACSSPRLIIWLNDKDHLAKRKFWREVEKKLISYELDAHKDMEKYTLLCETISKKEYKLNLSKDKNKLYRISIKNLNNDVIKFKGKLGLFLEYDAKSLDEVFKVSDDRIQTLTYFGFEKSNLLRSINIFRPKGFDRIVPIGNALEMDMIWDGKPLPHFLSRVIQIH